MTTENLTPDLFEQAERLAEEPSPASRGFIQFFRTYGPQAFRELAKAQEQIDADRKVLSGVIDEVAKLREERDRMERNRDMWKGQVERQSEALTKAQERIAELEKRNAEDLEKLAEAVRLGSEQAAQFDAQLAALEKQLEGFKQ